MTEFTIPLPQSKPKQTKSDRRAAMPKVGNKHFPYTPAGEKAAKGYAKKTGKKVESKPPKKK
jgi:hypothetical protein